jgi:undecaprenyl-diphosphatase
MGSISKKKSIAMNFFDKFTLPLVNGHAG